MYSKMRQLTVERIHCDKVMLESISDRGLTNDGPVVLQQLDYVKSLAAASSVAEYSSIGDSFEGREMGLVTVSDLSRHDGQSQSSR